MAKENRTPCICLRYLPASLRRNRQRVLVAIAVVIAIFLLFQRHALCFEAPQHLREVLFVTGDVLEELKMPYFLHFGTLLGSVRGGDLIQNEYDIDIGISYEDCMRLKSLKGVFAKKGLELYTKDDYVSRKVRLTYDHTEKRFMFSSPYLNTICARAYHKSGYFSDIYGMKTLTPADVIQLTEVEKKFLYNISSWTGYDPHAPGADDLVCEEDAFKPSEAVNGSCILKKDLLPYKTSPLGGRLFPIPAESEKLLETLYGSTWRTPISKGVKAVVCQFDFF